MKRFYKEVAVVADDAGYGVRLDGKPVLTPARRPLLAPCAALAEAMAAEWEAQKDTIKPDAMPLTRLANSAIDGVSERRLEVVADLTGYAETDLICYWAEHPRELAARQAHGWRPLLDWAASRFGANLQTFGGVMPQPQPADAVAALGQAVAAFDPFHLAALHLMTTAMGSLVLALAVAERRLDAEAAFDLAEIDERYQREQWGEDQEAALRRARIRTDVKTAARFLILLGSERPPSAV